eukprot:2395487-Heterocapsa_arctica.AAC.1
MSTRNDDDVLLNTGVSAQEGQHGRRQGLRNDHAGQRDVETTSSGWTWATSATRARRALKACGRRDVVSFRRLDEGRIDEDLRNDREVRVEGDVIES